MQSLIGGTFGFHFRSLEASKEKLKEYENPNYEKKENNQTSKDVLKTKKQ